MSAEFSSKLTLLRQNAGLSQKQAANDLGISQALLSHYEKGIRECSLDFVVKAAEYYNVSSDYMLGASSAKKSDALTDETPLTSDRKPSVLTVLRALVSLSEDAERLGDENEEFFTDFFSVCVKKYLATLGNDSKNASGLCDLVLSHMTPPNGTDTDSPAFSGIGSVECVDTSKSRADILIKQYLDNAL